MAETEIIVQPSMKIRFKKEEMVGERSITNTRKTEGVPKDETTLKRMIYKEKEAYSSKDEQNKRRRLE